MQVKSFAYVWMHVCLPYLICAICVYERILLYNICTYFYNLHTRIHTYATSLFLLRRYSYPVERRALILMSISGPGLATVLRRDSRKHNEKCHGTDQWGPSTGGKIRSYIPAPINFKNASPFITSRHLIRLMVTDSPWRSRSNFICTTAFCMRHHFSYRSAKYNAMLLTVCIEISILAS